jgi:uncharacterized protein YndB with AHSA1/START domain
MLTRNSEATSTADREVVIERVFDAPRELVFDAWTDPNAVSHWFGPNGFTLTNHEMDVRPGGVWRFIMHGPDGTDYPNKITFEEVVEPERLVYQHGSDSDDRTLDFHVTVTFDVQGKGTKITMRSLFATAEARNYVVEKYGAIEGANQTLERLARYLAKD